MSTSELENPLSPGESSRAGGVEVPSAGSPFDLAAIGQLANEFFRALPGQAPTSPLQSDAFAPGASASAPVAAVPNSETRLPQFGEAAPSVPALPSATRLPSEADAQRVLGSFSGPSQSLASHTGTAPSSVPTSDYSLPGTGSAAETQAPSSVSPFAMPLSIFETALPSLQPSFADFSPAPAFPTEDFAASALRATSSYYFLEDAGALSKPVATLPRDNSPTVRSSGLPELHLSSKQFDIGSVRRDFPILQERVNGHSLIWLDNAATTQKPQSVIDRISYFYEHENSNIHRAAHELAARATDAYEDARSKVTDFLNASSSKEIVFVRGATEAINLVAQGWGRRHIGKDDEIVITWIEHHANIVPWQMLAAEKGARLRVAPVDDDGQVLLDEFEKLLGPKTKLVSVTQVSNALGTITPAHQMVQMAHRYGARVLVDGAQAVSHMPIDVQSLDCDFYVFSGHKVFAPTGIGVLYGKPDALVEMPPWQGGGNMIVDVTFEKTIYQPPPSRFEAGTGNIADAVGLGAAIDYLDRIGMPNIARYEHELLVYATKGLMTVPGLRLIGTAKEKAGVLSFVLEGFKTEEVGAALNREGIAVRSGHHCAQPTLRRFGVETTVRPSLALYNNYEDIDALIAALLRLKRLGA